MKNYRIKASFIIDGLATFTILIVITTTIFPFTQQLNQSFRKQLDLLEDKKVILVAVNHYQSYQLEKGVNIGVYKIIQQRNQICTIKNVTNETTCVKLQN